MSALTDREIKLAILEFLVKKGRWGACYFPTQTLVKWFAKKVKRNGKRVMACLKLLIKDGYLLMHKKGRTISLNPSKSREIIELIRVS
jgi:hypothetical protein